MKILVMCEGPAELEIINILLDDDKLKFDREDLLNLCPFHARNLECGQLKPAINAYNDEIKIYRVGDTLSDKLKIPKQWQHKISEQRKFCTKPEIEMLLIISDNRLADFEKVKSKLRPKSFCKQNVAYNRMKYNNSTEFYKNYFCGRTDLLVNAIKEYHRTHKKHAADEGYLFDLLK